MTALELDPTDDPVLLDAYSEAVTCAVGRAAPAVLHLAIEGKAGASGAGSGVVFTPDGYVLTNAHVVAGAERITARWGEGVGSAASLVGEDPDTDLALLRLAGEAP